MARMFGYISNRPDIGFHAVDRYRTQLAVQNATGKALGWGVGFYQSGEVLLRRRPSDSRVTIDLSNVVSKVRADILIGHVRYPSVGSLRTENTHPFRYRQWLFACTEPNDGFDGLREKLLEMQPEFLRANLRGDTDSEVSFHSFLAFLHEAGKLDEHLISAEPILDAVRKLVKVEDGLRERAGLPISRGDALVTNGEYLVALHRSGSLAARNYREPAELAELLSGQPGPTTPHHLEGVRLCLLANGLSELPSHWERVEPGSLLVATRTQAPELFTL